MKPRKQRCSNCSGSGKKPPEVLFGLESRLATYNQFEKCTRCEGEGVEILISPKQWEEYQWLEKIADELEAKHIEVVDLKKN